MIAFLLYFLVTLTFFGVFFKSEFRHKTFWMIFFCKLLLSAIYFLIYKFYFQIGDIFTYDSLLDSLNQHAVNEPIAYLKFVFFGIRDQWIEGIKELDYGNQPFARFSAIFHLISGGNIAVTGFYYVTLLFSVSWYIYRSIALKSESLAKAFFVSFFMIPSIALWTSGFAKEGLIAIMLQFLFLFQFNFISKNYKTWFLAFFIWFFLLRLRHFVALIFLLQCVFYILHSNGFFQNKKRLFMSSLSLISLMFGMILLVEYVFGLSVPQIIHQQYNQFLKSTDFEHFILLPLNDSWWSLLKSIPIAFAEGWILPFPKTNESLFYNLIRFENVFMILGIIFTFSISKNIFLKSGLFCLVYVLILSVLLPLLCPEIGTLVRYKVMYLPFIWMWMIYTILEWKSQNTN